MSQLKEILEKERERSTLEQCAAIHLFREGTFYRAYEWSAWLCVRYFTELRFAELCGAHRKETGCVGIGTTPRMVCCTQFLLWLAFALEQLQCQTEAADRVAPIYPLGYV